MLDSGLPSHFVVEEIVSHAECMKDKRLQELLYTLPGSTEKLEVGKGGVGNVVQGLFGLDINDSRAESDFPRAVSESSDVVGLELKVIPLKKNANNQFRVKERQVINMINFNTIQNEIWEESSTRKKMSRILNIYYSYEKDRLQSRIVDCDLWEIPNRMESVFKRDWEACKELVCEGRAHELSESMFRALSANRKGAGKGRDLTTYVGGLEPANRRSFSLKVGYLQSVWSSLSSAESVVQSIVEDLEDDEIDNQILMNLNKLTGMTGLEISEELGVSVSQSKQSISSLVRHSLAGRPTKGAIHELDERGLQLRTVPVRTSDNKPWESTSFPAVSISELLECEYFEDHPLSDYLSGIVFLPCLRENRKTPKEDIRIGKPVVWRPSTEEWNGIRDEWNMYKDYIIENGVGDGLPPASSTRFIHMRPKARDSTVVDYGPYGESITKQGFWLNKDFVQSIIIENR